MLATPIQKLLQSLKSQQQSIDTEKGEERAAVNELTSKAGRFYERIRYLFDYKDEHTIRRSAVERQLKRHIVVGRREGIGPELIQELISGGYLPNRTVSEETGIDVQNIIERYLLLDVHNSGRIRKHLISLAATEIDQYLKPQYIAEHTLQSFYETVRPHISHEGWIVPHMLDIQTYIACRRSLLEEDEEMLLYALWLKHVPGWHDMQPSQVADQIPGIFREIEDELTHSVGWLLVPRLKNYKIYFLLLKKVLERYGTEAEQFFNDESRLNPVVTDILKKEYEKQYTIARKSGVRAIIYILFTKIIVALALEFPAELYFYSEVNYLALGSNVLIHPLLLFLMTRGLPKLHDEEIAKALRGVQRILQGEELETIYTRSRRRGLIFDIVLLILYAGLFALSFGILVSLLSSFGFNAVSIILFLLFLTLVSYFGFRIRHNAQKWLVSGTGGTLKLLFRILTLPIVRAGRWLSRTFSTINVFVFLMDFIIETPFKLVLGLFDAFVSFLREKEEEIY